MDGRVIGGVALALVVGLGGGWALAATTGDDEAAPAPTSVAPAPLPADPSLPVKVVQPDPDDPALATGIALRDEQLAVPDPDGGPSTVVRVPVPQGWDRSFNGLDRWVYTVPGNSDNSYSLRVQYVGASGLDVADAVRSRAAALDSAQAQGNMSDVETTYLPTDDGFDSSYIDLGGFRRVGLERFYPGPDGRAAFTVAGSGRVEDEQGLQDLLSRITAARKITVEDPADLTEAPSEGPGSATQSP
ncbi:hypothetical protein [Nocardioides litoris]|uniref:hypothetical protein n=1 Tax=Nocardioides litoris TaxID=1926648 RepID=UPI001124C6B1|nr:hypothetical protein [Nocardioides litoris]